MSHILAVDPGLTTGLAVFEPEINRLETLQIRGRHEFYKWFRWVFLPKTVAGELYITCEDWKPRAGALTEQADPHRIIGWLDGEAALNYWPFSLHTPGQVKKFATDLKLKAMGWWVPGQDHARDGLRHLLYFLVHNKHPELAELRAAYIARLAEVLA